MPGPGWVLEDWEQDRHGLALRKLVIQGADPAPAGRALGALSRVGIEPREDRFWSRPDAW